MFFFQAEDGIRDSSVTGVQTCSFFFQAEDGIRDSSETGVQTCALPISLAACCLALAAGSVMARTSPLRGVVEGYYGRPWPGEARRSVIRFLGARGMNAFVYGPKNDPYHRDRWREHYPDDQLGDLRDTAAAARRARVRFIYAISPGLDICYACAEDFDALTGKLEQLARAPRPARDATASTATL